MSEERVRLEALPTLYPRVFSGSPMSWGFEHGDGWCELIETLCARLDTILQEEPGALIEVRQVKEKFGGLRFYYNLSGASDALADNIRQAVDMAAQASSHICERCGRPGSVETNVGWLSALCAACRAKAT
ncbi:hypothetical protein LKR43_15815 [Pusillimonas sp. MFBS29]|uniref:hypothetical protein n=1 Tax=Pusillimonas sp. MFBS29 TaxID=2886690 RepID=UPI001D122837|nr:hypothetical protein [Pusillimonas sp. MFBS29]MCC2597797.1 hypothetical protein [Pusillimonas sp. MFBS29]